MTRNLAFEWRRATSLRSSYGFPLIGIVLLVAASLGNYWLPAPEGSELTLKSILMYSAFPIGVILLTVIFAQAFGHEYRDGTMRLVLSEFPGRTRVFLAKLMVPAVFVVVSTLIVQAVILIYNSLAMHLAAGGSTVELVLVAGRALAFTLWWGLMVAAITALMRNLAGGIVVAMILGTLGETLLIQLIGQKWDGILYFAPFTNAGGWVSSGDTRAGVTALVWLVIALGAAWWLFEKRDA